MSRTWAKPIALAAAAVLLGAASGLLGVCGPFTDVSDAGFCPFVLEIFYLGITTGTTPTTYDPAGNVTRLQMAAFLSRGVDGILRRGSRRALLKRYWTPQNVDVLGVTTLPDSPNFVQFDGRDLWVSVLPDRVLRVRASDGRVLETWTGALAPEDVLPAMGSVFVAGGATPGSLYRIDSRQPGGAVTTVASNLGDFPNILAFDGLRIWSANGGFSVSIVTPGASLPWTVTTVTSGFETPRAIVYDGSNMWVTDSAPQKLLKLNASGAVIQTVTLSATPAFPVFDGTNLWVPGEDDNNDAVVVVRAATGAVLGTLTGNGLNAPVQAAFDGQRVLVTNFAGTVSLWKAADLAPLGTFPMGGGTGPFGASSDGVNFWVSLVFGNKLIRF